MSGYAWAITIDKIFDPKFDKRSAAGYMCGPRDAKLDHAEIIKHPKGQRFRMKDDDGTVYYHGVMVDISGHASGFEPLDDYGTPNAGCTTIEYFEKGNWHML